MGPVLRHIERVPESGVIVRAGVTLPAAGLGFLGLGAQPSLPEIAVGALLAARSGALASRGRVV